MGYTTSDRVSWERHSTKSACAEGNGGHALGKEHKIMVGSTSDPGVFSLLDSKVLGSMPPTMAPMVTSQLGTIINLTHVKKSDSEVFDALILESMESSETSCQEFRRAVSRLLDAIVAGSLLPPCRARGPTQLGGGLRASPSESACPEERWWGAGAPDLPPGGHLVRAREAVAMEPGDRGSFSEVPNLPSAAEPKESGVTNMLLTPGSQESLRIRDVAEALTQWGQLAAAPGDRPEKHRSLVLVGLPISKPAVISQLEYREKLEREASKAANPDWETIPESKELTPEKDFAEEESVPGVLIERFPKEGSSGHEDSLENQQENHKKPLIQEVITQKTPSGEATSVMSLEGI
ncbi:5'-AMP-activated protein kinase subunit beta-2 [Sciurus carolinensis]|uniref:5'-AMP-activated protein kinase subunit beta-2 n=1 Tax=Sciurus carolinensis TaxID=30640 RepID=A0AA41NE69_SCICA|nr:5'-AMP-activated protein kinase subunit beta-2 [Sciurus carolinensis]